MSHPNRAPELIPRLLVLVSWDCQEVSHLLIFKWKLSAKHFVAERGSKEESCIWQDFSSPVACFQTQSYCTEAEQKDTKRSFRPLIKSKCLDMALMGLSQTCILQKITGLTRFQSWEERWFPLLKDSTNDREPIFGCLRSVFIMFSLINTTTCTLVPSYFFLSLFFFSGQTYFQD